MMALGEILAARAETARAAARVECGGLGTLVLEALPVRELERLTAGGDGDRAIFYAACRELQRAGEALLARGKVFRPDQVTELISDGEAAAAAEAVRRLSGWRDGGETADTGRESTPAAGGGQTAETERDTGEETDGPVERAAIQEEIPPGQALWQKENPAEEAARPAAVPATGMPEETAPPERTEVSGREEVPAALPEGIQGAAPGAEAPFSEESVGEEEPLPAEPADSGIGPAEKALPTEAAPAAFPEEQLFRAFPAEAEPQRPEGETPAAVRRLEPAGWEDRRREAAPETQPGEAPRQAPDPAALAEQVARALLEGLEQAAWVR